jgi:TIR domain/Tetratricopeptide repeat
MTTEQPRGPALPEPGREEPPGTQPETPAPGIPQWSPTTDPRVPVPVAKRPVTRRSPRAGGSSPGQRAVVLVSYAGVDRAWAEWVAWQLAEAGHTSVLDLWDWAAGHDLITGISEALARSATVILLLSHACLDLFCHEAVVWEAPDLPGSDRGRLVPVRVEDVPAASMPAALQRLGLCDVFGMPEELARQALLAAVPAPSHGAPVPWPHARQVPGVVSSLAGSWPPLPGTRPRVWNIPARNREFTGRDSLIAAVRDQLLGGARVVVQAMQGTAGVGKTQLAAEYAHRFAGTYDLAWWITADQPALIGEQFSALAAELGCTADVTGTPATRPAVLDALRNRGRWLLVFDNATSPDDLAPWFPGGSGHVLITSQWPSWDGVAAVAGTGVFTRTETVAMLRNQVTGLGEADADQLAAQLGDLPLAVTQAAAFMAGTGITAAEYLNLLRAQVGQSTDSLRPVTYPPSLEAVTRLTAGTLAHDDAAALEIAALCAFLAPGPVPANILATAAGALPAALAARVATPSAWHHTAAVLARYGLAQAGEQGLRLHRLTQAILRDLLTPDQATAARERSEAILAASNPGDPASPTTWPQWERLMPHLLAAGLADTTNPGLRMLACDASWYLLARGDAGSSDSLASDLYQHWRKRLGSDNLDTLAIGHCLAWALREKGQHTDARDLNEDILARKRRVLGADHPSTLATATALASTTQALGDVQAARDLNEDTLARKRRVLGADHPSTLATATALASTTHAIGGAYTVRHRDAHEHQADHTGTLTFARDFGIDLREPAGTEDSS